MRYKWGINEDYFSEHNHNHHFFLALKKIKELGFDGILMLDSRKYSLTLSEIKKGLKESELSLIQLHSDYFNMANPDPEERKRAVAWYKKRVEYALELEAEQLVIHPGGETMCFETDKEIEEGIERNAECLKEIIKEAQGTDLKIALENTDGIENRPRYLKGILEKVKGTPLEVEIRKKGGMPPDYRFGSRTSHLVRVIEAVKRDSNYPNLGICLDTSHAFATKFGLENAIFEADKYIISTHLHDTRYHNNEEHLLPGRGLIKWDRIIRILKEIGYSGPFILEVSLLESDKRDWDEKAKLVRKSKKLLEDLL